MNHLNDLLRTRTRECSFDSAIIPTYFSWYFINFKNVDNSPRKKINYLGKENVLMDQWESLINVTVPKELLEFRTRPELFWFSIRDGLNDCGIQPFKELGSFALEVMTTPHGNADPERSFSAQNNCQTKNRSQMVNSTLDGSLRSKEYVLEHEVNGVFVPTDSLIEYIASGKYYS